MNKLNKISVPGLLLALFAGFVSCNLDEKLTSTYGADNAYVTVENAQEGVNGIYRYMNTAAHPMTFYVNDMSADDCYKAGMDFEIMNDAAFPGNIEIARVYNGNWQIVGCANSAVDNITMMDDAVFAEAKPANKKLQLIAEARFLRAFAYYQLTNVFYRVPLITNGFYDASAQPTLATVEALDDQIEKDLLIAANDLPDGWDNAEGARPPKSAAYGYLMRLHMRKAGRLREQGVDATESWRAASNYADLTIATGGHGLMPTPAAVFDPTSEASRHNREIIFAVRSSDVVPSGSSDIALYFTPWDYNMGWDIFSIPLEFYWQCDPADTRTALLVGEYPAVYEPDDKVFKVPATIDDAGKTNDEGSYPIVMELAQAYTDKYLFAAGAFSYNYNTPNNLPLLRFADVLLCKAEILNELDGVNQVSVDLLNRIRERAYGDTSHNAAIGDFATAADFRSALCDERLLELNNEGVRRIDLIRMGLWKDRMDAYMDAIRRKVEKKEENMGMAPGSLSAEWSVYPKFSNSPLKKFDKRRYYPIPNVYTMRSPDLANNRDFAEE